MGIILQDLPVYSVETYWVLTVPQAAPHSWVCLSYEENSLPYRVDSLGKN